MNYRQKFDKIKTLKPRPRGFAFEKLLNEIFDDCKVLINDSYKTSDQAQQIDGAIEVNGKIFLLEAKWENEDTLAASKLYSFLGKINSKIEGTIGIFISYNKLKDNFVNAIRNGLRQNCILIHGEDNINDVIDGKLNLDEFVWYCFRQASTKNRAEISTSEFISLPQHVTINIQKSPAPPGNTWVKIYTELTDNTKESQFIANLQNDYQASTAIPNKTLNIIPSLSFSSLEQEKLRSLIEKISDVEKEVFIKAFIAKLKSDTWRKYAREQIIEILPKKICVNESESEEIINSLTSGFDSDWEKENDASRLLDLIFDSFTVKNIALLAKKYLYIYVDGNRENRFEQKQFAEKVFGFLRVQNINPVDLLQEELLEDLDAMRSLEEIWIANGVEKKETIKSAVVNRMLFKYKKLITESEWDNVKTFFEENVI